MEPSTSLFPRCFEESCARFHGYVETLRRWWPETRLHQRKLYQAPDMTVDWIEAEPVQEKKQVLILTAGEHGIEGYVGSAMLDLFLREFASQLDPRETGLVLVHAICPWGMKHYRRVNMENVDLNRNFVWNGHELNPATNPDYASIEGMLNPKKPVSFKPFMQAEFLREFTKATARLGAGKFRQATLLGQYRFTRGIYFGGSGLQQETSLMMGLFRDAVEQYSRILLLDMHTGYGPRYQLNVINSVQEPRDTKELERVFQYPHIVKTTPEEFYSIRGDMVEFLYTLVRQQAPGKHVYATSFEFGTLGDNLGAALRSLQTMVFENQMYWYGGKNPSHQARFERDMLELFYPQEEKWKTRAVENARKAFQGILRAEGYLAT